MAVIDKPRGGGNRPRKEKTMDDYDWDALSWLESRCMDYADEDGKQCYPDDKENEE